MIDHPARIKTLMQAVKEGGMDAYLVTSQDSIYYLTGASYKPLERPFIIVIWPDRSPELVVPLLEKEHIKKAKGIGAIHAYFDYPSAPGESWHDVLKDMLKKVKHLGVEPSVPVEIINALPDFEIVSSNLVDDLRMIKTGEEIALIRRAAFYADKGMDKLVKSLYSGISVIELFSLARSIQMEIIRTGDYDPLSSEFLTVGWPAPKSAQPHSVPDLADVLKEGPLSLMSFLRVNGYAAECERTVFMGKVKTEEKELFGHMINARQIAFRMVKPGVKCEEIDLATRDYFSSHGLSQYILHRTGHGIGLGNHEMPWLSAGSQDILKENMVVSIEPALYVPDIGGFRHSDTVLVTSSGYECLTKYVTDLDALNFRPNGLFKSIKGKVIRKFAGIK